jgi:hypothetical protein
MILEVIRIGKSPTLLLIELRLLKCFRHHCTPRA